ncbi:MAG: hypothetical protein PVJ56_17420, partial [Desulfobacterales bacterium]
MRFLSFKVLTLCIILPPVCYIITAFFAERYSRDLFAAQIENIYTGDLQPLLDGSVRLQDVISQNIDAYLKNKKIVDLGLKADVRVVTEKGKMLYPSILGQEDITNLPPDPSQVAADNFSLIDEGLVVKVETKFDHNTAMSNSALAIYIMLAVFIFFLHYKSASRKAELEEREAQMEISRLRELEEENTGRLEALKQERQRLQSEFGVLKEIVEDEQKKAERNEDELIEEIEALEAKLNQNIAQQDAQQEEIIKLEERIEVYEKGQRKVGKQKQKAADSARKRFNALYKNLSVNQRAVNGFLDLNEDLKIKAEEVIHQ